MRLSPAEELILQNQAVILDCLALVLGNVDHGRTSGLRVAVDRAELIRGILAEAEDGPS